jgi:hypothetical protein
MSCIKKHMVCKMASADDILFGQITSTGGVAASIPGNPVMNYTFISRDDYDRGLNNGEDFEWEERSTTSCVLSLVDDNGNVYDGIRDPDGKIETDECLFDNVDDFDMWRTDSVSSVCVIVSSPELMIFYARQSGVFFIAEEDHATSVVHRITDIVAHLKSLA